MVPPGEEMRKIKLEFLEDDDEKQLPMAQACFNILRIPTVHSTQQQFEKMMDIALKCESSGFELM